MTESMKRASDLRPPKAFPEVERVVEFFQLADNDADVVFCDYQLRPGQYGNFMVILGEDTEGKFTTTTGAKAVVDLILSASEQGQIPFIAKVVEETGKSGRRYYSLV